MAWLQDLSGWLGGPTGYEEEQEKQRTRPVRAAPASRQTQTSLPPASFVALCGRLPALPFASFFIENTSSPLLSRMMP